MVRTICTAADNAAGVEGIAKRNSAEALTGEPSAVAMAASDPLTETHPVGRKLGGSFGRATHVGQVANGLTRKLGSAEGS
jgi:hypothetical protein